MFFLIIKKVNSYYLNIILLFKKSEPEPVLKFAWSRSRKIKKGPAPATLKYLTKSLKMYLYRKNWNNRRINKKNFKAWFNLFDNMFSNPKVTESISVPKRTV